MDGIEWMASAMAAARARLNVATHNLSNVASDGFRKGIAHARLTPRGIAVAVDRPDAVQGVLRHTGRSLDLALVGPGAFAVAGDVGGRVEHTRSGAFVRDRAGFLVDEHGRRLLGERGAVRLGAAASIDGDGRVRDGGGRIVDRLRLAPGTSVRAGFLEGSNVDAVGEMIEVLDAQRAFETAQKTLVAIDDVRSKAANDTARVKS
jgi:flagellar basal body rod protein FlgG